MPIVARVVRHHCHRFRCTPSERDDLTQDGYLAASAAASTYDASKGASYSTWIIRRVQGQLLDSTRKLRSHGFTHVPPGLRVHCTSLTGFPASQESDDETIDSFEVADCLTPSPDVTAEYQQAITILNLSLSADDLRLLSQYFGFDGQAQSLRQIAAAVGVSHVEIHRRLERTLRLARGLLERGNNTLH